VNANGIAEFNLDRGTYTYKVEMLSHATQTGTVSLTSNKDLTISLQYVPCAGKDLMTDEDNCGSQVLRTAI
jgi:hypothetical protein